MLKKSIPILGFILITIIFFWQFLFKGFLPIPADTIVGLYYPYRDIYKETNPNGIPFKNFLITDPVRQQIPWRSQSIDSYKNSILPKWNPYSMSGTPNLANFQSAVFYPFNLIFFISSFYYSWSILILIQPLLAGIFLFLYLRNLRIDKYSSFLGGVIFAFSGFSAMWLEWGSILHTALWLPLILLSIDKIFTIFEQKKFKNKNIKLLSWITIFTFSIVSSFFAGHLQTFFYLFLFSFVYLLIKIWQAKIRLKLSLIYLISILVSLIIILPQLIPTIKFINLSARELDLLNWQKEGWFLPLKHLIQFIVPDFFGNPTTLNYWGTWNYGELTGYIGLVGLILAIFAILFRRDKKTYFYVSALFLALLFSISNPISKLPFLLNIPFISTAQPTRLLFIVDFSLSILAALGLNYLLIKGKLKQILFPIILVGFALTGIFLYIQFGLNDSKEITNLLVSKRNIILPILIFISSAILLIIITISKKNIKYYLVFVLILIAIFEIFRFSWKFNTFANKDYLYPETKSIAYIKENIKNHRIATADPRIMAPNFFIIHRISSVEGYDPLFLDRYAQLVSAINRNEPNISPPYGFNRIVRIENFSSNLNDLLGVKYVMSINELNVKGFNEVVRDGETRVYENEDVLPNAFFVDEVISAKDKNEAIKLMFEAKFDPNTMAIVEDDLEGKFSKGKLEIEKYSNEEVIIETENDSEGFLVLTDSYYPTWRVKINGNDAKIYRTDFNFRGVIVPKGVNTVEFKNSVL